METILIAYGVLILVNAALFAWIFWKDCSTQERKDHARKED